MPPGFRAPRGEPQGTIDQPGRQGHKPGCSYPAKRLKGGFRWPSQGTRRKQGDQRPWLRLPAPHPHSPWCFPGFLASSVLQQTCTDPPLRFCPSWGLTPWALGLICHSLFPFGETSIWICCRYFLRCSCLCCIVCVICIFQIQSVIRCVICKYFLQVRNFSFVFFIGVFQKEALHFGKLIHVLFYR